MFWKCFWLGISLSASMMAGQAAADATSVTVSMAMPRVEGPVTGGSRGYPYSASIVDLAPYGYTENEYFVSGKAQPFMPAPGTELTPDGRWQVVAGEALPYKTRILVRKPPPERFNGTVIVEFMQEYFGSERDTNYLWNAEAILREGFGWVGASLHHEGIDDPRPQQTFKLGSLSFTTGQTMARWDAERYGSLSVPSSDLSFDILSQIGRAMGPNRPKNGVDPFEGLKVRKLIAVGNTIAAERLAIYLNGVQPVTHTFDGFFLQDLVPGKLQLSKGVTTPTGFVRADTAVPVIVLKTLNAAVETTVLPEGPLLRYWEPAGSSHTNGAFMARVAKANVRDLGMDASFCATDYANSLPVQYISSAAIVAVHRWVNGGEPAPRFPQLKRVGSKPNVVTPFDTHGNVAGGLRNPWVDVPVARYDWRGECVGGSGRTFPFTADQLRQLYGTPQTYRAKFAEAVREAQLRGVLLPEDAKSAIRDAQQVNW